MTIATIVTIDELLEIAISYVERANSTIENAGSFRMADTYTALALAAATTAQAMMMRETGNERTVVIKTSQTQMSSGIPV